MRDPQTCATCYTTVPDLVQLYVLTTAVVFRMLWSGGNLWVKCSTAFCSFNGPAWSFPPNPTGKCGPKMGSDRGIHFAAEVQNSETDCECRIVNWFHRAVAIIEIMIQIPAPQNGRYSNRSILLPQRGPHPWASGGGLGLGGAVAALPVTPAACYAAGQLCLSRERACWPGNLWRCSSGRVGMVFSLRAVCWEH